MSLAGGTSPHHHTAHMSRWPPTPPGVVVGAGGPPAIENWWAEWPSNASDEDTRSLLDTEVELYDNGTLVDGNWTLVDGNWTKEDASLEAQVLVTAVTAVILGVIILATIIGEYPFS